MSSRANFRILMLVLAVSAPPMLHAGTSAVRVTLQRVPDGGVQPQVAVDPNGNVVNLIYLTGDPSHSDIYYRCSPDGGQTWSPRLRVNSQPGSALAIGTVRGAQIALGCGGRVHVAWMGSGNAEPNVAGKLAPMLYARLSDDGRSFEPQRNVIASHAGLDGGGSIAADLQGNVFIAWHAPNLVPGTEQDRRVWVARSVDDGKTFAPEVAVSDSATGACGCCGMRVWVTGGRFFALYRGAAEMVNRGMYLVVANSDLSDARNREISPMKLGMCVMSTAVFATAGKNLIAAWETKDRVCWSSFEPTRRPLEIEPNTIPSHGRSQKHPVAAFNAAGQTLVAWAEGIGWNKGGSVAWQVFDESGRPILGAAGEMDDLPAWDAPASFVQREGSFVVLY